MRRKLSGLGVDTFVEAVRVSFDEERMSVVLSDGRTLGIPLAWFPKLLHARPEQRRQVTISTRGLHWEDLNEDISIAGLLAGRRDMTRTPPQAA